MQCSNDHLWYEVKYHPTHHQPFDYTTFVWEALTVHGNELCLFMDQDIPHTLIVAVETIFNVFSYDAVSGRDSK